MTRTFTSHAFFVQHVDEVVNSQLRDRYADKMARLQKG